MEDFIEIEARVIGRVQMVLFRDFTKRQARRLELRGFVKNNDDESVTVVAQGGRLNINELIKLLNKGPIFSKVKGVFVKERNLTEKFDDFFIKY